jgi:hypothetical protein
MCVCESNLRMAEQIFMKLGMYIMVPQEPLSTAYFINPSHQSVCLYVYLGIVVKQRLCRNVTATINTHATIEELLDAIFFIFSLSWFIVFSLLIIYVPLLLMCYPSSFVNMERSISRWVA